MACVEDTNRIKALALLCKEAEERKISMVDLDEQIKSWKSEVPAGHVVAYGFG